MIKVAICTLRTAAVGQIVLGIVIFGSAETLAYWQGGHFLPPEYHKWRFCGWRSFGQPRLTQSFDQMQPVGIALERFPRHVFFDREVWGEAKRFG
jgi:hypothetical protein